jgi:hypothetical protein
LLDQSKDGPDPDGLPSGTIDPKRRHAPQTASQHFLAVPFRHVAPSIVAQRCIDILGCKPRARTESRELLRITGVDTLGEHAAQERFQYCAPDAGAWSRASSDGRDPR